MSEEQPLYPAVQDAENLTDPSAHKAEKPTAPLLDEAFVKPARNTVLTIALAPVAVALPTLVSFKAIGDHDLTHLFRDGDFMKHLFASVYHNGVRDIAPVLIKSSLAFGASAAALYALHTGQFSCLPFTSTDKVIPRMVLNPRQQRMLKHVSIMTGIYAFGNWVSPLPEPTDNPIHNGAVIIIGFVISATFLKSAFILSVDLLFE